MDRSGSEADLTLGAPDLYPIRTTAKEEQSTKESMHNMKPIGDSGDCTVDSSTD